MYAGDVAFAALIVFVIALLVGVFVVAINEDKETQRHEEDMRNQYSQCVKAGKEWVLTEKYGIDGICVTKR